MQWHSFGDLLILGGYGIYVWPSFGATAVSMLCEVLFLYRRYAEARSAVGQAQFDHRLDKEQV